VSKRLKLVLSINQILTERKFERKGRRATSRGEQPRNA